MPYAVQSFGQPTQAQPQRPLLRCDGISNFRAVVRKLWADHVLWTRQYIVSVLAGLPDQATIFQRLMTNQDAIGQAVVSFLGPSNGLKLTKLLREHVQIAGKIVAAAKTGNQAGVAAGQKEWSANALAIATLLNQANPRWPLETLIKMLQTHLDLTAQEVAARLAGNWTNDIATFDASFDHAMRFADFMANGMLAIVVAATGRRR